MDGSRDGSAPGEKLKGQGWRQQRRGSWGGLAVGQGAQFPRLSLPMPLLQLAPLG